MMVIARRRLPPKWTTDLEFKRPILSMTDALSAGIWISLSEVGAREEFCD